MTQLCTRHRASQSIAPWVGHAEAPHRRLGCSLEQPIDKLARCFLPVHMCGARAAQQNSQLGPLAKTGVIPGQHPFAPKGNKPCVAIPEASTPRGSVLRERHAVALRGRICAAAAPLAVAVADSTNATAAATNTTAGMNTTTDAPLPEAAIDASGLAGAAGGEAQRAARGTELVRFAQHTPPCRGALGFNTAPPSATHRAQQYRVSLEASRERGGAHAHFSTLAPQPLSEPMAAAHRACEACLPRPCATRNDAATATPLSLGAHLAAYTSLSLLPLQAAPLCETLCEAANRNSRTKKAGLGARCSRGDPRPFFGRARVSFLACLLVNKPL